ncbi:MAG: phosphoribosylglycinamide formyltransferase [Bacteroidales bacterium]|jgi:phosphoribosylglycinamide formyltransferase-1|nr:phosphoribosylglycinamide formyltransferase [Bacteroidales bacterium]
MNNIAIFASGSGSNAENIIGHFSATENAKVTLILSNNRNAFVLKRAERLNIKSIVFDRNDFYRSEKILDVLQQEKITFIVLAGFLWLVPAGIIGKYAGKIINIHPALLPLYGGRGMYGDAVHKAVIENREKESGITIHLVNGEYDSGDIIFQARCPVEPHDDYASLADKIHTLEYMHFPRVIEDMVSRLP